MLYTLLPTRLNPNPNPVQTNDRGTCELFCEDDSKGLRNHFGLWPSDLIIAEVIKSEGVHQGDTVEAEVEMQGKESPEERKGNGSAALQVIKSLRHYIRVQFNDPRTLVSSTEGSASSTTQPATHPSNDTTALASDTSLITSSSNATTATTTAIATGDIYTYSLRVSSELTLHQLKEEISKTLMDPLLCFHVQGASFKDESKSLLQLGLCNMSILHLVAGKGCLPGMLPLLTLYTHVLVPPFTHT